MTEELQTISLKQQIYLETVYELSLQKGHTHIKLIAEKLSKRMPSVTEAMRKLADRNLINHDIRKNVSLTSHGWQIAKELEKRHDILADFYCRILGCPPSKAQNIACKVEHIVDTAFCFRIAGFASFIRKKEKEGVELIQEFKEYYTRFEFKANTAGTLSSEPETFEIIS
ncbi:MAG: metal-dependent transcriptional regulator [Victivallales bacterium]|nr:metal-dependent transcriptional regulator [Victivallales bacterium]